MTTAIATKPNQPAQKPSALAVMASRLSVDPAKMLATLKGTVFQKASEEEMLALVAGQPGLWRVPVTIRGVLTQAQLVEILRRIESSDRLMVIDEFQMGFVQGLPNITLTAVAYYRVGAAEGGQRAAR